MNPLRRSLRHLVGTSATAYRETDAATRNTLETWVDGEWKEISPYDVFRTTDNKLYVRAYATESTRQGTISVKKQGRELYMVNSIMLSDVSVSSQIRSRRGYAQFKYGDRIYRPVTRLVDKKE